MFCENCGEKLNKNDKFCEKCGFGVKKNGNETENEREKPEKFVSRFTLIFAGLIFLAFSAFWIYKFGIFNPQKGTSVASASALWGQFVISILSVVVFDAILIFLDIRKKAIPIYKLVSFWFIVIVILLASSFYTYCKLSFGKTHTYQEGQEFNYGPYSFIINSDFGDIPYNPNDCSGNVRIIKDLCESNNKDSKTESETNQFLILKIKAKNNSKSKITINENWLNVFGSSGKEYNVPLDFAYSSNLEIKNMSPGSTKEGSFNINVSRSEQEFKVKVILSNKAEQIVVIKK